MSRSQSSLGRSRSLAILLLVTTALVGCPCDAVRVQLDTTAGDELQAEDNEPKEDKMNELCGGAEWCYARSRQNVSDVLSYVVYKTGCKFKRRSNCNGEDSKLIGSKDICKIAAGAVGYQGKDGGAPTIKTTKEREAPYKPMGCYAKGATQWPSEWQYDGVWFNVQGTLDPAKFDDVFEKRNPICCTRGTSRFQPSPTLIERVEKLNERIEKLIEREYLETPTESQWSW